MTASWFEIDRTADRLDAPGIERYRLRDPWGDYAIDGEEIRITFTPATDGPVEHCRAIVTGHDKFGAAIVTPLWPPLAVVGDDIPGEQIPATVTPLPTRPSSPFPTGGEAS